MNLRYLSIKNKLLLLFILPMIIIFIFGLFFILDTSKTNKELELVGQNISKTATISELVHLLQLSRGLSMELSLDPNSTSSNKLQKTKAKAKELFDAEFSYLLKERLRGGDL